MAMLSNFYHFYIHYATCIAAPAFLAVKSIPDPAKPVAPFKQRFMGTLIDVHVLILRHVYKSYVHMSMF